MSTPLVEILADRIVFHETHLGRYVAELLDDGSIVIRPNPGGRIVAPTKEPPVRLEIVEGASVEPERAAESQPESEPVGTRFPEVVPAPSAPIEEDWLSVANAAAEIGLNPGTVYAATERGTITSTRINDRVYIKRSDLEALKAERHARHERLGAELDAVEIEGPFQPEDYVTFGQAADEIGIERSTIRDKARQGCFPVYKDPTHKRRLLIKKPDWEAFKASRSTLGGKAFRRDEYLTLEEAAESAGVTLKKVRKWNDSKKFPTVQDPTHNKRRLVRKVDWYAFKAALPIGGGNGRRLEAASSSVQPKPPVSTPAAVQADCMAIEEIARLAQVSEWTVRNWMKDGRLPYTKPNGRLLARRSDVETLLATRRPRGNHSGSGSRPTKPAEPSTESDTGEAAPASGRHKTPAHWRHECKGCQFVRFDVHAQYCLFFQEPTAAPADVNGDCVRWGTRPGDPPRPAAVDVTDGCRCAVPTVRDGRCHKCGRRIGDLVTA